MTEKQWVEHFMRVLDKGIKLYTEALETKNGDHSSWLFDECLHDGLCSFFEEYHLSEVGVWVAEVLGDVTYLAPVGKMIKGSPFYTNTYSRRERFALRLKVLKDIKKQLS